MYTQAKVELKCKQMNSELVGEFTGLYNTHTFKCLTCESLTVKTLYKFFSNPTKCVFCKKDYIIRNKIRKINLKFESTCTLKNDLYNTVTEKVEWTCKNNHTFVKSISSIISKNRLCVICCLDMKIQKDKQKRYPIFSKACHNLASSYGGIFASDGYVDAHTHYLWKCKNNHEFKATYTNVKKGHWCPYCIRKTEEKVRSIFELKFNQSFPSFSPDWLTSPFSNKKLILDGYNEELRLAFEYDGEYHFKPHYSNKDYDLDRRIACDNHKNMLCSKHGIKLIRIPYTEKNNLEVFINKELERENK